MVWAFAEIAGYWSRPDEGDSEQSWCASQAGSRSYRGDDRRRPSVSPGWEMGGAQRYDQPKGDGSSKGRSNRPLPRLVKQLIVRIKSQRNIWWTWKEEEWCWNHEHGRRDQGMQALLLCLIIESLNIYSDQKGDKNRVSSWAMSISVMYFVSVCWKFLGVIMLYVKVITYEVFVFILNSLCICII